MADGDPRKALHALANEHGLPILRFLRDRDWTLASQVAEGLGIHTSTASKHLAAFYAAGLLDRRPYPSKRPTLAYRLRSNVVRLEINLAGAEEPNDVTDAAHAFLDALMAAAHRVGGPRLAGNLARAIFGTEEWRPALSQRLATSDPGAALEGIVASARAACAELIGMASATRLLRMALAVASEGHGELLSMEAPP